MSKISSIPSVLLEQVDELIKTKLEVKQAKLVLSFVHSLFKNVAKDDLIGRSDSDLYGASLSLWHTLNRTKPSQSDIRVFNPELAKHGWKSPHTIVEIICPDSPFLVDSVRMVLHRLDVKTHWLLHSPLRVTRNKSGKVTDILDISDANNELNTNTVFLIEIDRMSEQNRLNELETELTVTIEEVLLAVSDWQNMHNQMLTVINELVANKKVLNKQPLAKDQFSNAVEFLTWLSEDNFTFMGYRRYDLTPIEGDYALSQDKKSSLGLMQNSINDDERLLSSLPISSREEALNHHLLILTKTNRTSKVHRPANLDYLGIKQFDNKGKVIGEHRFIGLFSSAFYNCSVTTIPFINKKIQRIMLMTGLTSNMHSYKTVLNILENYPRDELLQASEEELLDIALGIFQIQERRQSRLFVRKDIFGRFYSCMAYVPRERYNTQLRRDTQELLQKSFQSNKPVEFTTYFSESALARTHYLVQINDHNLDINVKDVQNNMKELAKTWQDKLEQSLLINHGEEMGNRLAKKYQLAFPRSYKENILPSTAVADIDKLEGLSDDKRLGMLFYQSQEEQFDSKRVKLKLFHRDEPIHLSDVLPMLENFGLRVIDESPYQIKSADNHVYWILDFSMLLTGKKALNLELSQNIFQSAFHQVWTNQLENDGFNKLVLAGELTGREVAILRAYAKYNRQIGSNFSQQYIESTFEKYPDIAKNLIKLFKCQFCPQSHDESAGRALVEKLEASLEQVANLDDDRIIRRFIEMIMATLRTNYFQKDQNGKNKPYISFKISPASISEMPQPLPQFEIFVYSPRVEGVHLRGGKVARGGLRWSDRLEDFRTEVLGLVKAQQVKNTVIVPVGAKGGFVCKQLPTEGDREAFFAEGQACYKIFIRALLDITDNIVKGVLVPPNDVVRLDDDDSYLVVAADKGTATFSDIANSISDEYNFWLGDAFASGGSVGYDHKKMGITAKGAWEAVKRHFRELDINCQTTDFSCVGVGDMSGDVFGNGMLLSKHICLQAAFNHLHIFIDPTPDSATSFVERQRLFDLPRSGWSDYNTKLISKGGGVFERSAKSIKLSKEIQQMIGITKESMTPNELIKALITMPVDLFWNGGIGTYIKGENETAVDVGDRANDGIRINGQDCNARVIGEGGNLGCTQLGRIEFAQKGGKIDTDFIDNVGGVDCSDNEVNIKILLNILVANGDMTVKQRNELLYKMTDEVSEIVLDDCYRQTHSISITERNAANQLKEHIRFIHGLEKQGYLDRSLEFLPDDDELAERQADGKGLSRPELSVLISYGKMVLKEQLLTTEITDDQYIQQCLIEYFPTPLQQGYKDVMDQHPLRAEIIATQMANRVVNDMGLNFVYRMTEETGVSPAEVVICYVLVRDIFGMPDIWQQLTELDNKLSATEQTEVLFQVRRTIRRASRWFMRHRVKSQSISESIDFFKPVFVQMSMHLSDMLVTTEAERLADKVNTLVELGIEKELAYKVASLPTLFSIMDIAQVAFDTKRDVQLVAEVYYKLGHELDLHWFVQEVTAQPVANHWQALARAAFREELDWQQRSLTSVVLKYCQAHCSAENMLADWNNDHQTVLDRWRHLLADFKTTKTHEFAKFSVALRELMLLSHSCENGQC